MSDAAKVQMEERVLAVAPAADHTTLKSTLSESGLTFEICLTLAELTEETQRGVGAVLLNDETLTGDGRLHFAKMLQDQPSWSDIPIVLLADHGADSPTVLWGLKALGNVTVLERPSRTITLVAALRAAVRARRRQYELREQLHAQALLAAVVESSQDAIISKTLDGIITSWNAGAERLFEYSAEEAIGRHISFLIPPHRQDEEQMILGKLRRGERIEHFETERITKSGRPTKISLTISPIRDANGSIMGASKVARDVTAQRQAQEVLRQSEQRFRFLAEMLPSIVWTAAPDGTITYVNQRWRQYCGLTPEQNAQNWSELVLHPDDRERCIVQWTAALRDGKPYEIEVRNRRHDGVYRWFVTRAVPLKDQDQQILAWFGVTTDIHDQKVMQEQLREADRRKDAFLATLAHELRNPLAPLCHGLYLLPKVADNPVELAETRRMMETQLRHMVHLLDDLLDISRIARNKIRLRKERVELAWVVNDAVETTQPLIEERGHHLVIELPDTTVHLDADPVRLAQVLSNLLNNAAKYTEPGGRIALLAERQPPAYPAAAPEVVIRVRDNGLGISPDMMPRIFGLFVQSDDHASYSGGGLGIGLSLVKSLVEMHGGRVAAHSAGPGQGSEFVVRLPVLANQEAAPVVAENPPQTAAARKILVVDDNCASADSMAKLLGTFGHDVRVAYDGPKALELAKSFRPDAAVLDLGLPGMDGHELARRMRELAGSASLTLIALTGWGQVDDRQRSLEAGFDAHMVKPVKISVLCDLLAQQLSGRL